MEQSTLGVVLNPYFIIVIMIALGLAIGFGGSAVSLFLGPKKPNPSKLEVYECGLPPQGTSENRFSVKFYLTAILFILFDIETIFVYLWSSIFNELGWFGIVEIGVFLFTLVVGLVYVYKRGALRWDT